MRSLIFVLLTFTFQFSQADVRVPAVFADHLVLQQNTEVNIWGWANPGEAVEVTGSWDMLAVVQTVADENGEWQVSIPTPLASDASGSQTLTIAGLTTIVFEDVLIGEVWILSGQSNMSIPLIGWDDAPIQGGDEAIGTADYPNLRLMVVGEYPAAEEQDDIHPFWDDNLRQWTVCTPKTVRYFSALGYFYGKQMVELMGDTPIGLIQCAWAGSSCEAWLSIDDLEHVENYRGLGPWSPGSSSDNWTPSVNWNGMLKPIVPYTMKGVLWYQGESNMGRAEELTQLFPKMIEGWRREWGQGDFPFCFAQLAPWSEYWPDQEPEFWEAQASALFLPNTGMVVTFDLVDADELHNIHPKRKAPIANRMARWVLANVYDRAEVAYSGPVFESFVVEGNLLRISFTHAESGLVAKDGTLDWFEVAGEDGVFHPAIAAIEHNTVTLQAAEVPVPIHARYGWSKVASGDLFNAKGLPAAPFRTQPADYVVSHQGNPLFPDGWDDGFYVSQGHLMDPGGTRVRGYGVNLLVSDYDGVSGPIAADLIPTVKKVSGSNIMRLEWNTAAKGSLAESAVRLDFILERCIEQGMIPVLSFNDLNGVSDSQLLRALAAQWMQSEYLDVFRKYEDTLLLDVTAGWMGTDLTDWHDTCFDVITILRSYNGGIGCPLLIESSAGGLNLESVAKYGKRLLEHDELKNLIFAVEIDGKNEALSTQLQLLGDLSARRIPLLVTRLKSTGEESSVSLENSINRVIDELTQAGIGYLAWVWSGDRENGTRNNLTSDQDWRTLSPWGQRVVLGKYGIRSLASVAPSLVPDAIIEQE